MGEALPVWYFIDDDRNCNCDVYEYENGICRDGNGQWISLSEDG